MQEIGDKGSKTAAVLCTELRCSKNSVLHIQDIVSAEMEARQHDGVDGHESVVVYTDYAHPLSHDKALLAEELTGVPDLDLLTTY